MDCGPNKVAAILSYCGSIQDTCINYSLLAVNVAAIAHNHFRVVHEPNHESREERTRNVSKRRQAAVMLFSLAFGKLQSNS